VCHLYDRGDINFVVNSILYIIMKIVSYNWYMYIHIVYHLI